jgi:DNA repair protein RadD
MGGLKLWEHQEDLEADIKNAYRAGFRAVLAVLPTGGGKTIMFTDIAMKAIAKGGYVLVLVHRKGLLKQASATLRKFGIRHGIINSKYTPDYSAPVQIATVGTIINRLGKIPINFTMIIADEAHHTTAPTWKKVIQHYKNARLLGVTATPCRSDGKGLGVKTGGLFDNMVVGPSMWELKENDKLVPFMVFYPPSGSEVDFSNVPKKGNDYGKKELAEATNKPKITGDAIREYAKVCKLDGRKLPAIVTCVNIEHAKSVATEFSAAGYKAEAVSGEMEERDIERILKGLESGALEVVAFCDLIGEGTDIPDVSVVIMLRRTMSMGLYIQHAGRASRIKEGKKMAYIIDHVQNYKQHPEAFLALVSDYKIEWALDGEIKFNRKKNQDPLTKVKQCPTCFCAHEPAPICPNCGHTYKVKGRELQHEEGELVAMTPEMIEQIKLKKRIERKAEEAQAQTLEELRELGKKRGYKDNWAIHRYNARQSKR